MANIWSRDRMAALTKRARMGWFAKGQPSPVKADGRRIYRADRRNAMFGRKPKGNTTPAEPRAIWTMAGKVVRNDAGDPGRPVPKHGSGP